MQHCYQYVHWHGGLGNQLYMLAFADYLSRQTQSAVYLVVSKLDEVGDTYNTNARQYLLEFPQQLGFEVITTKEMQNQIAQPIWYKWANSVRKRVAKILGKPYRPVYSYWEWNEPKKEWASFFALEKMLPNKPYQHRTYYGYFQSYHYIANDFITKVAQVVNHLTASSRLAFDIQKQDVAIHIRRGDFLSHSTIYRKIELNYYLNGLAYLSQHIPIQKVYIFSDDFENIQTEIAVIAEHYEVVLVQGQRVLQDMALLNQFQNYVLGNSTFAWWGAMLSKFGDDTQVVVPEKPWVEVQEKASAYLPHWVVLPNE